MQLALATPFVWRYTTDGNENGDAANTGFCFNYQEFTTQPTVTTNGADEFRVFEWHFSCCE